MLPELRSLLLQRRPAGFQPLQLLGKLLEGGLHRLLAGADLEQALLLGLHFHQQPVVFKTLQPGLQPLHSLLLLPGGLLPIPELPLQLLPGKAQPPGALLQLADPAAVLLKLLLKAALPLLEHAQFSFQLLQLMKNSAALLLRLLPLLHQLLLLPAQLLDLLLPPGALVEKAGDGLRGGHQGFLNLFQFLAGTVDAVGEQLLLQPVRLLLQLAVAPGNLGLLLERFHLALELKDQILNPHQVFPGFLQAPLGFFFAQLVL